MEKAAAIDNTMYFMIFSLPWRFWTNFPENNVMGVVSREAVEKLKKSRLNSKGRKYFLFPLLERNNIDSWEKLDFEMNLIDEKKSELSSNLRSAVNHLHTHIMLNYLKSKEIPEFIHVSK